MALPRVLLLNLSQDLYLLKEQDDLWEKLNKLLTTQALQPHRLDEKSLDALHLDPEDIVEMLGASVSIRPMKR